MSGLCCFWCHFYMVFDCFRINFDDFWWPGGRLETLWFSMVFWGVPELRNHGHSRLFGILPGPHCQSPNSFKQQFNMQNTSWNMLEWRDTKKQDAKYENTKNQSRNMLSLQQRKQEKRSSKCFAAWWPLFEGPADFWKGQKQLALTMGFKNGTTGWWNLDNILKVLNNLE